MKKTIAFLSATLVTLSLGTVASADDKMDKTIAAAIEARKAQMDLYAFNLGALGAMAKGEVAYDAEAASKAAANLAMLTQLDQSRMWPAGSDEMGADNTRALPKIWDNLPDVMAKSGDLTKAAMAMETAAGSSLDDLRGAMGAVGGACSACHKAYRAPKS